MLIFEHALARNLLHKVSRNNSILFVCDVDVTFAPEALILSAAIVQPGVSAYFPIVFSLYDPEMVNLTSKFFGTRLSTEYSGRWRPYGTGNYMLSGQDAKEYMFDESFIGWGGEDAAFFSMIKRNLNILLLEDKDIVHRYHNKSCSNVRKEQY